MAGVEALRADRWGRWSGVLGAGAATSVAAATLAGLAADLVDVRLSVSAQTTGPPWLILPVALGVAACVLAAWMALDHPRVPVGLALVLIGWLVPIWAAWAAPPDRLRSAFLAAGPLTVLGIALAVVGWRNAPTAPARRSLPLVAVIVSLSATVHLLGYDPFADPGCRTICSELPTFLAGTVSTRQSLLAVALLVVSAGVVVVGVLVFHRPAPRSVMLAGLLALASAVLACLLPLISWSGQHYLPVQLIRAGGAGVFGGVVAATRLSTLRTRRSLNRLVACLGGTQSAVAHSGGRIREAQFAVPGQDRWVDAAGQPVPTAQLSDSGLVLWEDGAPAVRLDLAASADREVILAGLTPLARLTMNNARLTAIGRAREIEVRASQRRIVATSDQERRRIERDLHDGAQQRLVSIAFHLRAARARLDPEAAERLTRAEDAVHDVLAGLRRLAHGIFPAALADEGLQAALEDALANTEAIAVLEVSVGTDLDLEVAMAVYAASSHLLAVAGPDSRVQIRVVREGGRLQVRASVSAAKPSPDTTFDEVRDRVGALGGTVTVHAVEQGGLEVTAVIPCE
jgi:signal transduction histidine kinase